MKIGEALQEVKELRSKLVRLMGLQYSLFNYIEGTQPDKTFSDYEKEINAIHDRIIELKLKIQEANLENKITVTFDDGTKVTCSIAKAILEVGRLRSTLTQLEAMQPKRAEYTYGKEQIVRYYIPLTEEELEEKISVLESMKRKYDLAIQGGNWTHEL